jgi:RNA polymerase sigma-32 factor
VNTYGYNPLIDTSVPMLTLDEERSLVERMNAGSKPALDRLLRSHFRLVFYIAQEFARYGLPPDDIIGAGLLGLTEAARRFDPKHGVRFGSYARFWVHAYMRLHTIRNRRITRVPTSRNGRKLLANLRRTQRELANATGHWPDDADVAKALGVPLRDVEEMDLALSGRDTPYGSEHARGEVELTTAYMSPEESVLEGERRDQAVAAMKRALRSLPMRDRLVMQYRYLNPDPISLAKIGELLGLSRERVRQIEQSTLEVLRSIVEMSP